MSFRIVLLLAVLCAGTSTLAQEPEKPANPDSIRPSPNPVQRVIDDQFGEGFKLDPGFRPLAADFDGDGTEDLALVVISKRPMSNMQEKNYKVVDPYDSYFGFGDPKITSKFDFGDGTSHCVLVMHDWRNGNPKMKFVIVNLPFEKLELGKMPMKKKTVAALSTIEYGGLNALVYWDGKKYRWEPIEFGKSATDAMKKE